MGDSLRQDYHAPEVSEVANFFFFLVLGQTLGMDLIEQSISLTMFLIKAAS